MTVPFVCDNGLTLLLERRAGPGFALELRLPFGAAHDPVGLEGATALLEAWLHKGAGGLDARALADAFDDLGVRRGGSVSHETARFTASGLGADLPRALSLIADIVRRPRLVDAELAPLVDLARQDLEALSDSPGDRLAVTLREVAFAPPYAHPVGGTLAALERLTPDILRSHATHLGPSGAVLVIVTDAAPHEIRPLALSVFGDWTPAGEPVTLPEARLVGEGYAHVPDDSQQTQLALLMPGIGPSDPDWLPWHLALGVLSGGTASRLWTEVREKRGLVYGVGASAHTVGQRGFVWASASSTPDRAQETLDVMLAEFAKLSAGVTDEEFARARTGLVTATVFGMESMRGRAASLARDWLLLGRVRDADEVQARLAALSRADLDDFLRRRPFGPPAIMTLGPAALEVSRVLV